MIKKIVQKWIVILLIASNLAACSRSSIATNKGISAIPSLTASSQSPDINILTSQTSTGEPVSTEITSQKNMGGFVLASPDVSEGGILPVEYTCDGTASTLALSWSGAPAGTQSFAVIMHHVASPTDIHWYWVVYDIPAGESSLLKNMQGIGTLGTNSVNDQAAYTPPCSTGPGPKTYTYTVYALSAEPQLSVQPLQVNRQVLLDAIKDITLASAELNVTYSRQVNGVFSTQAAVPTAPNNQSSQADTQQKSSPIPPMEAIAACVSKAENDTCSFSDNNGDHTGICETTADQLACAPDQGANNRGGQNAEHGNNENQQNNAAPTDMNGSSYNIAQAISDKALGMTIAFDALAFLTGDLGADSFFPPGKVADFWGFQYLRDNDPSQMGHAGEFLTSAADNMLNVLTSDQRAQLVALAKSQVDSINEYGYMRFVLIQAFQNLIDGKLPAGTTSLDEETVKAYSAQLYLLDGEISYARAQLYGSLINSFTVDQKAYLDGMKGVGMLEWPKVQEPSDIIGLDQPVKVAVMTYAADMFSWYVGSVDADVYFCPERHGTYFGSFYLKDIKAMSDPTYAIPTNMTGELGDQLLSTLTINQAQLITGLVDLQKPSLLGIVDTRRQVSIELRKFLAGETPDHATVLALMQHYGELDGEIIYHMAIHFTQVSQSLTTAQEAEIIAMRTELLGELSHPTNVFLYSEPIPMPEIPNTDFLFK
jgi:phosphatidylethanolamine-binding protein (PEBP) family uncharacterized protein